MSRETSRKGLLAEIAFETRLVELGYSPVCRPSRVDEGVDFVVLSSRGWIGVQVKAHTGHVKHQVTGARRSPAYELRLTRGRARAHQRGKGVGEYYRDRGVAVYALHFTNGFYLIPIDAVPGAELSLSKAARYWEAWTEVLGEPGAPMPEPEITPLERMWNAAPVGTRAGVPGEGGASSGVPA